MKRFAIIITMVAVLAISFSIAQATKLMSPWLVDHAGSSWGSQVILFNTTNTAHTANFTFVKVGDTATTTNGSMSIPGRSTIIMNWTAAYPDNWSGFITTDSPNLPAGGRFATFHMNNVNAYFVGFTFRFQLDYSVIYSEALFAWPVYAAADGAGTPQYSP